MQVRMGMAMAAMAALLPASVWAEPTPTPSPTHAELELANCRAQQKCPSVTPVPSATPTATPSPTERPATVSTPTPSPDPIPFVQSDVHEGTARRVVSVLEPQVMPTAEPEPATAAPAPPATRAAVAAAPPQVVYVQRPAPPPQVIQVVVTATPTDTPAATATSTFTPRPTPTASPSPTVATATPTPSPMPTVTPGPTMRPISLQGRDDWPTNLPAPPDAPAPRVTLLQVWLEAISASPMGALLRTATDGLSELVAGYQAMPRPPDAGNPPAWLITYAIAGSEVPRITGEPARWQAAPLPLPPDAPDSPDLERWGGLPAWM